MKMIDNEIPSQSIEIIREEAARDTEEAVRRIEVAQLEAHGYIPDSIYLVISGLLQATHTVREGL